MTPQPCALRLPLSDLQQAYIVGESGLYPLSAPAISYHIYALDIGAEELRQAARQLIERHPMLRAIPDGTEALVLRSAEAVLEAALAWIPPEAGMVGTGDLPEDTPFALALVARPEGAHLHVLLRLYAFDARAMSLFYADLSDLLAGQPLPLGTLDLPPDPTPSKEELGAADAFWARRLADLPPAPDLSHNLPADGKTTFTRRRRVLALPFWQKLKDSLPALGLTQSALLAACYAEVLGRLANTRALTLATLVSRRRPADAHTLGNFGTTTLLGADLSGASFLDRAHAVQIALVEAAHHSALSAIAIARRAGGEGGPRNVPYVFSSGLGMQTTRGTGPLLQGPGIGQVSAVLSTPQVLVDHQVHEEHGALILDFDIVDAAFLSGWPERLVEMVHALLQRLATKPALWRQSGDIALLPADARERADYNTTGAPIPPGPGGLAARLKDRAGDGTLALADPERSLSGETLERESAALAAELCAKGLGRSDLVAVVAKRGWRQVVATLAIARAGAAYLPLSPDWPAERLRRLMEKSGARAVICDPAGLVALRAIDLMLPVLTVPDPTSSTGTPDRSGLDLAAPSDLAYVIYTSGSTGEPKGVALSHGASANTIADICQRWNLTAEDRVLGISALHFDLSVFDIFGFAATEGALVLPSPDPLPDPAEWRALVERHDVTVWNSVPTLFEVFLDHLGDGAATVLRRLKLVMLSGDWVPPQLVARVKALAPETRVVALGGATEAAIWSIYHEVEKGAPAGWTSVPYGRPLRAQGIDILDETLTPLPPGAVGEIHISGYGLAEGYYREAALTEAAFVHHPASGARYYRTGDMGRFRDGEVEFLGRRDGQVKLRGNRIELGEIEAALEAQPGVRRAACLVIRPKGGEPFLAAAAVGEGDPGRLREALTALLPATMVPQRIILLQQLPLTANGKVDRSILTQTLLTEVVTAEAEDLGRSPEAALLADLWQEVGAARPQKLTDDFFALAGTSLGALRLSNLISQRFGIAHSAARLFQDSRFAAQLQLVTGLNANNVATPALPSVRRLCEGDTTLCLIHPVGGSTACYLPLVGLLPRSTGVLALEAGEATGILPDFDRLVVQYAELLSIRLPREPVVLGGWSMGATLAAAVAGHRDIRDRLAGLVLIDPYGPNPVAAPPADRLLPFFQDLLGLNLGKDMLHGLPETGSARIMALAHKLISLKLMDTALAGEGLPAAFDRYVRLAEVLASRADRRPAPLPCPTLVLEAEMKLGQSDLARLSLLADAEIERLAGTHHSIVTGPDRVATAERIGAFLAKSFRHSNSKGLVHAEENY